ncbi:MAG: SusC/RagA family TonB-linked outer membrane protein [Pseudoflavonifractor sp.]|nr:SusC/RagA family TonB-linked outer membrane protein [Pseudoflavonifractor sp.]
MKKLFLILLAVTSLAVCAVAQTRTVKGVVLSEGDDEPLIGATVLPVGGGNGTSTDLEGKFTVYVPQSVSKLKVSYVGMGTKEVAITSDDMIIWLSPTSNSLDEVVVTAMGISRSEKTLGYSATAVSGQEITAARDANVLTALSGKVAGLQVQTTSSDPGSANNVQIRGLGSINGNNNPLYIVDGVPVEGGSMIGYGHQVTTGGISNLSADDIESLTVLKGAAATALYGSRAANGVIMVTTKSGSKGTGKNYTITYSGGFSARRVSLLPEMQNEWGQGWNGNQTYIENGSWGPRLDGSMQVYGPIWNNQQRLHEYSAKKNNVRDFFDTGWSQNHSVAISGISKDEAMTYYLSYSYTGDNGIIPTDNDSYKRNTIAMRGTYKPEKWLKLSSTMNFATTDTKTVGSFQGTSVIDGVMEGPRDISFVDMKDLSNPFNTPEAYFTPYGITNPYWAIENNYYNIKGKQIYGKIQADVNPIPEVTLSYRFGFDYSDYDMKSGTPEIALDDALIDEDYGYAPSNMNQTGNVYSRYNRAYELNHDFLAMYANKFFDNRFDLNATVGVNINERYSTYMYGQTDGLTFTSGFWQLSNGSTITDLAESQTKRRMVGLFGDVTLGWDDFVFVDLTARNDWSSTLPIDNNSFFYPGVTLSGIFTKFIPNKDILTFGKVRVAYGKTGNDARPYYTSLRYMQAYTYTYYGMYGSKFPMNGTNAFMASNSIGSNELRPEMTSEFEAGLDLKFFNGRIGIDASYYNRVTSDQIFTLPVDPSTGFASQVTNFGKVRNRGFELVLNTIPLQLPNFTWELGFNFAINKNKVLSMPESLEGGKVTLYEFQAGSDAVYMYAEEGREMGTFYTYLPQYVTDKDSPYYGAPIVDSHGQPVLGTQLEDTGYTMNHKWTGGVTTSLSAFGVTLSAVLDIRAGGHMFSRTKNLMQFTGNGIVTRYNDRRPFIIPGSVVDNGDGTYSPNTTPLYLSDGSYQSYFNDYGYGGGGLAYLMDRSYTKLRNISLTWDLPRRWVNKACLSAVSITAYVNNAFIWTAKDNRYVDPETTTTSSATYPLANYFGETYSNPSCRSYGMNLKVTF